MNTKERPIIFSAEMVRAILAGRKTQTRRMVKVASTMGQPSFMAPRGGKKYAKTYLLNCDSDLRELESSSPYGKPGEKLWVREAWRIGAWDENEGAFAIDYCDGPYKTLRKTPQTREGEDMFNRLWADSCDELRRKRIGPNEDGQYEWEKGASPLCWRPSIHMPRWASRITLEVTGVRVQRLHDISDDDAIAEGVERTVTGDGWRRYCDPDMEEAGVPPVATARQSYFTLWNTIHGHGTWTQNPWVWVIEFRRIEA